MVAESFGGSIPTAFVDNAGGGIGLTGRRVLLSFRHYRQRSGIGQRLDAFMSQRGLLFCQSALQGKQRFQHFHTGGVLLIEQAVQMFDGLGLGIIGMSELFLPHVLMEFLPCLCAEL